MNEEDENIGAIESSEEIDTSVDSTGYQTLAQGILSPRHRRLAQLAAEGSSNADIGRELGYVDSRVSILLRNPHIRAEINRLQERLFEETIQSRLKALADPAISNIEQILKDRTNRVKVSERLDAAKWVVEKLDGKATQKTDIGENLLSVFIDKLDAKKIAQRDVSPNGEITRDIEIKALTAPEKDELESWVDDFCSES